MKCPKCNKEIDHVEVKSTSWQRGLLEEGTNKIIDYEPLENRETKCICPECIEDITDDVEG